MKTDAEQSEAMWIEAIQSGHDEAFDSLVERYQRPVLAYVYRMIGDADEAQDLAQEVFVRAYRAIQTPRFCLKQASLSSWLFQIARNASIDHHRKRTRKPFLSIEQFPGQRDTTPAADVPPAEQVVANELQERIEKALLRLPENQRTALTLSVYHQQTHEQIAAVLKCSTKSVESRIYRARQKLAQWLL